MSFIDLLIVCIIRLSLCPSLSDHYSLTDHYNNLGVRYENGKGVLKDDKQAVKWYQKAADQGNASAQYNLGAMYADSTVVLKDLSKAKYWIKKAYENPDASASALELAEKAWNQLELWKY